jgi:predicted AlkP superfamily pyrophosphatase or phosphodiesterase
MHLKIILDMKIKIYLPLILSFILLTGVILPQNKQPKLVVGIVVDQMRFDYLYRYQKYFGKGGFMRLVNNGSNFTFAHYNYSPTTTGPGHASIYTGTTPYYHGIIANDWYDKAKKKMIYCANDKGVQSVGSNDKEGEMSPKNLLSTTITDQLKLSNKGRSKVIAVSLKDRSAVLPGGHFANGAFWYDNKTGDFITSSYYMKELPGWVNEFNKRKLADKFLREGWNLSHPMSDYSISDPDESNYEKDDFNEGKTSFPHLFNKLKEEDKYERVEISSFGNYVVEEFAKTALVNENLGKHDVTDFLTVSFSSTDHVAHDYGNYSYEIEDIYLRLDLLIDDLLKALDKQVGKNNYLLFLTADHAALETPGYLKENRLPTGELNVKKFTDSLNAFCKNSFGDEKIIENFSSRQIYLNRSVIKNNNLNIHDVEEKIQDYIRNNYPVVTAIFKRDDLEQQIASRNNQNLILNGYHPALCGDIIFSLSPGYLPTFLDKGTTHQSMYPYDTHVPLLFYGWNIPEQTINNPVYTVDIAATVANLLKIQEPSASMGIPLIKEVSK